MLSDYYAAKIYKKIDTLYRKVLKLLKKRTRNADSAIFVTMESIKKIFKIGNGPSSSHTMAPRTAALDFAARNPHAAGFSVTLYGSLAATGKGHFTDKALENAFHPKPVEIAWDYTTVLKQHPNGMEFRALNNRGVVLDTWLTFSIGGGDPVSYTHLTLPTTYPA